MAEAWELESATPGPVWPWGVTGATCISTTLYWASDGTTTVPGRMPDLRHPGLLLFHLEAYSLAFNVFERTPWRYQWSKLCNAVGWGGGRTS